MSDFNPDWELPAAPAGDDEEEVKKFFYEDDPTRIPWEGLDEWQREAWRREYRHA